MENKNPEENNGGVLTAGMKKEEFYARLREELNNHHQWPTRYMFKFILPNEERRVDELRRRFEDLDYDFKRSFSRNGKYVSLTFITEMTSAEAIIDRYRKVEDIEGLIAL